MRIKKAMRMFAPAAAIAAVLAFSCASLAYGRNMGSSGGGRSPDWTNHNTNCTTTMGGLSTITQINGDVTVPSGASCTLEFVSVSGNVNVQRGGSLLVSAYIEPSNIGGSIEAYGCASTLLEGNVKVKGSVLIGNCTGKTANGFQGPGVMIGGDFLCHNNAGPCEAWLGEIDHDVAIQNNGGAASDVSLNTISGNLECQSNTVAPTHVHGYNWVSGRTQGQCGPAFSTTTTSIGAPEGSTTACAALISLASSALPVPNTVITSATVTAASSTLPERCIVNGYVNQHTSPVDNCQYLDSFQVQLPLPAAWNRRFFFQGGSGTEGSVPAATGANAGSGSGNFGITNGYAVATQDGGHENSLLALPSCDSGYGNSNEFYLDPEAQIAKSDQSVQVTVLTAKYLIAAYYGENAGHSYMLGCSDGGARGMAMSQNFPQYFDGIVAGDPGYDLQSTELGTGIWDEEALLNVYNTASPALPTLAYHSEPAPEAAEPILYPAFPASDQALVETALLQACDALDGVADGVIDNLRPCQEKFDPATATYTSGGVTYPLQCPGAKNTTCLSLAQIQAIKAINQGPRLADGRTIQTPEGAAAPDHVNSTVPGFPYDGGWMTTLGIPSIAIGTTTTPGANLHLSGFGYQGISPADPAYNTLTFNFNSPSDLAMLARSNAINSASASLDISKFISYGHKIIWYHGASDPRVPLHDTTVYYNSMANQFGCDDRSRDYAKDRHDHHGDSDFDDTPRPDCLEGAQRFSRLYPVPNMGHCDGGAATDEFDMITPIAQWVENGTAPGPITATGVNFTSATYQVAFVLGEPDNAPATRSRPLCPYPQEARFTGSTTVVGGVPVATNPSDLAVASNYKCVTPSAPYFH